MTQQRPDDAQAPLEATSGPRSTQPFPDPPWGLQDGLALLALALVGTLMLLPYTRLLLSFCFMDEGVVLEGGLRMLHGQVPYRDFQTYVAPLSMAYVAAFYALLGVSVTAHKVAMACQMLAIACSIYIVGRPLAGPGLAWGAALGFACFCPPAWPIVSYHWLASLCMVLGLGCYERWLRSGSPRCMLAAGVVTATALLTAQNAGATLLLFFAAALAAHRSPSRLPAATRYLGGLTAVLGPVLAGLAACGALRSYATWNFLVLLRQAELYRRSSTLAELAGPLANYLAWSRLGWQRRLAIYPLLAGDIYCRTLLGAVFCLVLALGIALALSAYLQHRKSPSQLSGPPSALGGLLALAVLHTAVVGSYLCVPTYLNFCSPLAWLLLATGLRAKLAHCSPDARHKIVTLTVVATLTILNFPVVMTASFHNAYVHPIHFQIGTLYSQWPEEAGFYNAMQHEVDTHPGDMALIPVARFSPLGVHTGRLNPLPYINITGLHGTPEMAQALEHIEQLITRLRPPLLVLARFDPASEDAAYASDMLELYRHLFPGYEQVLEHERALVMRRRDLGTGAGPPQVPSQPAPPQATPATAP